MRWSCLSLSLGYDSSAMDEYQQRLDALIGALKVHGLSGAVVAASDQMRYLVGWAEAPGERMLALIVQPNDGSSLMFVPSLYEDDVRAHVADFPVVAWHDNEAWPARLAPELSGSTISGNLAVDDELASGHLLCLQKAFPGASWVPLSPIMAGLRGVKSADEIARMERSAKVADAVCAQIVPQLEQGVSERTVQQRIIEAFAAHGATSSWAIVCFGPHTALPHHRSGDRKLQQGDLVILDLGCCFDGYQSDITRTGSFGPPPEDASRIYEIVYEAPVAAMAAARPGVTCESADAAARTVIARNGYGDRFIHRTGHGIGLSTHEPPNLVEGDRTVIAPGMCFSDEPGIYLTDKFGVRIENIISITDDGARSLNAPAPKTLPDWSVKRLP